MWCGCGCLSPPRANRARERVGGRRGREGRTGTLDTTADEAIATHGGDGDRGAYVDTDENRPLLPTRRGDQFVAGAGAVRARRLGRGALGRRGRAHDTTRRRPTAQTDRPRGAGCRWPAACVCRRCARARPGQARTSRASGLSVWEDPLGPTRRQAGGRRQEAAGRQAGRQASRAAGTRGFRHAVRAVRARRSVRRHGPGGDG